VKEIDYCLRIVSYYQGMLKFGLIRVTLLNFKGFETESEVRIRNRWIVVICQNVAVCSLLYIRTKRDGYRDVLSCVQRPIVPEYPNKS
jgi:hypothetical protein